MSLTDIKVKSLKPHPTKDYKESDEKGLYLLIKKDGSKYWRFKYRFLKKEKLLALGVYPEVSLANARIQRDEAREQIRKGIDPSVNKKAIAVARQESSENSFEVIANEWLMIRNKKSDNDMRLKNLLKRDLFPQLGSRPIKEITPPELLQVLRRIENRTIEMASRARKLSNIISSSHIQQCRGSFDNNTSGSQVEKIQEILRYFFISGDNPPKILKVSKKLFYFISSFVSSKFASILGYVHPIFFVWRNKFNAEFCFKNLIMFV